MENRDLTRSFYGANSQIGSLKSVTKSRIVTKSRFGSISTVRKLEIITVNSSCNIKVGPQEPANKNGHCIGAARLL